ncbi:MAG: hypothetical protein QOJ58_3539 [Alphaproteobacteria bacterium]|jgi:hypothetical protein|nr:hypothetical protein [Alphaproteobacteria bacterium]
MEAISDPIISIRDATASPLRRPIGTFTQTSASMATADKMSVRLFGCLVAQGRFCVNFAGE